MATCFPVDGAISGINGSSEYMSCSAANLFSHCIEIGSSISFLLHSSSQGCGQTLPIDPGRGIFPLISSVAASNSPLAISPTYPWQSVCPCLLYTSDAADEEDSVDLGGRRIIKKKQTQIDKLKK